MRVTTTKRSNRRVLVLVINIVCAKAPSIVGLYIRDHNTTVLNMATDMLKE
jgi:hypothetical protein